MVPHKPKTSNNGYTTMNLENLRKVYFRIKKKTNELLEPYNDNSFVKDPSVDIEVIARENGITDIIPVSPREIAFDHAKLEGSVLKLNKKDSPEEKRFSIAHDLKHFIWEKPDVLLTEGFKKPEVLKKPEVIKKVDGLRAARSSSNSQPGILKHRFVMFYKFISKYIAEFVSKKLGKQIPAKKACHILEEIYFNYSNDSAKFKAQDSVWSNNLIANSINKLYDEEIADYFAANLLVPTERFILWEDKSDRKIAGLFKVPIGCIKKRREEIRYELDFTTLKNLSSGDKI